MSTEHEHESVALVPGTVVRPFARAALVAALTGAVAYVSFPIPFSPVPLSLQVLFVFIAGLYLGPIWGAASMLLYIATGAAGAPIFANGGAGIGVLVGYTGGYLWSYPIAAFVIGAIVHGRAGVGFRGADPTERGVSTDWSDRFTVRDPAEARLSTLVAALTVATLVIYAMGAGYAMWLLNLEPGEAIMQYAVPFVVVELVKMAAAISIVRSGLVDPT